MAKSTKQIAFGADQPSAAKWGTARKTSPIYPGAVASPKRLEKVAKPQFATEPVWAQKPDTQPTISPVPLRRKTLARSFKALRLTSKLLAFKVSVIEPS